MQEIEEDEFMTFHDITVAISSQGDNYTVHDGTNARAQFPIECHNVGVCYEGSGWKGGSKVSYSRQEAWDYVVPLLRKYLKQNRTVLVMTWTAFIS